MLIEGCYNLIEKCLYNTQKCVTVSVCMVLLTLFSKPMLQRLQSESVQINTK